MTLCYLELMTDSDLDKVVAIERNVYDFPWTRSDFEDSLRNNQLGLCLRKATGMLVGYCVLMLSVDEMHLLNLCVTPSAQGQGSGLTLLCESVRIMRMQQLRCMLLEVRQSNWRAMRLYNHFGFIKIGKRKNYYAERHSGREDAIVMRYRVHSEMLIKPPVTIIRHDSIAKYRFL
ncbi:ribosomal protein S18-alanine N-acetyltransferase [Candidatus Vallotia lariciata]|uniref:ribosomal protein S18-alanine N-acetyltransferase n=1 Tax=Candidatus Vallotia laricis TaxID=2018052 RepID=UPI001D02B6F2|nr:ribosomal protein S18-alanine N-acetyltransferase [Candidatus Vallotia lariciata]UDG82676.1 ribosomal protein S18-alanine N-acetyltransferase [Candidatus Vallotia lariciata]